MITSEVLDETLVVSLDGDYDLASKGQLVAHVVQRLQLDRVARVLVDLDGLRFMDSTGLNDVVRLGFSAGAADVPITVRCTTPGVRRLFEITGLDHLLEE